MTLDFDVPMLNDTGSFDLILPEGSQISYDVTGVTVAKGSNTSSPFRVKLVDSVVSGPFVFHVRNTGGTYLNNDLTGLLSIPISGLTATYAVITTATMFPVSAIAGGDDSSQPTNITIDVAPVNADLQLLLEGVSLIFVPSTVTVKQGQLTSEPFKILAAQDRMVGTAAFTATPSGSAELHNDISSSPLHVSTGLTISLLKPTNVTFETAASLVAGVSPAHVRLVLDVIIAAGDVVLLSESADIVIVGGVMVAAGSKLSDYATITAPRSVRPGTYSFAVQPLDISGGHNNNDLSSAPYTVTGLVIGDGFGPLLNITNVVPYMLNAQLTVTSDEACSVWCKCVSKGAIAPAIPADYTNHPADANFTAAGSKTFNITGLIANKEYDVYCYGVDAIQNADVGAEVNNGTRHFKTLPDPQAVTNGKSPVAQGLPPASVAGIIIGVVIGVLLAILLAVGIRRWLNNRNDWTKNESLFLEAELAQKKKPSGVPNNSASPAPAGATTSIPVANVSLG
jgi:tetrahydromethanopterin S-methyltransferase subunit B